MQNEDILSLKQINTEQHSTVPTPPWWPGLASKKEGESQEDGDVPGCSQSPAGALALSTSL